MTAAVGHRAQLECRQRAQRMQRLLLLLGLLSSLPPLFSLALLDPVAAASTSSAYQKLVSCAVSLFVVQNQCSTTGLVSA